MSSAPRRSALNCELTFTSDEFGIDVELEPAVRPLLHIGRELADEAIAEVAGVDGAAGKLVGNLERRRSLREGSRAGKHGGNGGDGACEKAAASDIHGFLR